MLKKFRNGMLILLGICLLLGLVGCSSDSDAKVIVGKVEKALADSLDEGKTSLAVGNPYFVKTMESLASPKEQHSNKKKLKGLRAYFENKLVINDKKVELYLNVRSKPNAKAKILSVLYPNDIVTYVDHKNGWYKIKCDGYTGYVDGNYVLTDKAAYKALKHSVAYGVMICADETYLYKKADPNSKKLKKVHAGDSFKLLTLEGNFIKVAGYSKDNPVVYVPASDTFLYYIFLGRGNSNELDPFMEKYLAGLDIVSNLDRAYSFQAKALAKRLDYEGEEVVYEQTETEVPETEAETHDEAYWHSVAESEAEASSIAENESYIASLAADESYRASVEAESAYLASIAQSEAEAQSIAAAAKTTETENASGMTYLGSFRITNYCHCPICCGVYGSWDPNYAVRGASGIALSPDYTVAVDPSQIPFGTKLSINGKTYLAADSGVGANCIDIYQQTHEQALAGGMYYADVYIIN